MSLFLIILIGGGGFAAQRPSGSRVDLIIVGPVIWCIIAGSVGRAAIWTAGTMEIGMGAKGSYALEILQILVAAMFFLVNFITSCFDI